jgi:hypothetical protein
MAMFMLIGFALSGAHLQAHEQTNQAKTAAATCMITEVTYSSLLNEFCKALPSLMPRLGAISEVLSTDRADYVVFNHNGQELWVYSKKQQAVRLLEVANARDSAVEFAPQWSADGRWLLFTSFRQQHERPRVFSVEKKRHYALPFKAADYTAITWAESSLSIALQGFAGDSTTLERFKSLGIGLTIENNYHAIAKR